MYDIQLLHDHFLVLRIDGIQLILPKLLSSMLDLLQAKPFHLSTSKEKKISDNDLRICTNNLQSLYRGAQDL